jgi:hypothetical protein
MILPAQPVLVCCVRIIQTVEQPSYMNWLRRRRRPSRQSGFGHHRALCRPIRLEVDSELRRSRSLRKKPSPPIRRGAQGILDRHILALASFDTDSRGAFLIDTQSASKSISRGRRSSDVALNAVIHLPVERAIVASFPRDNATPTNWPPNTLLPRSD